MCGKMTVSSVSSVRISKMKSVYKKLKMSIKIKKYKHISHLGENVSWTLQMMKKFRKKN